MSDGRGKDGWDKLGRLSGFLAAVLVPIVIALAGHWYANALNQRETALREQEFAREYVQIALTILREEQDEISIPLRAWAVDILDHYSNEATQLSAEAKEALIQGGARIPRDTEATSVIDPSRSRFQNMIFLQEDALRALLARNIDAAIEHLSAAHRLWHDFRNVYEVLTHLRGRRSVLWTPGYNSAWQEVYRWLGGEWDLRDVNDDLVGALRAAGRS